MGFLIPGLSIVQAPYPVLRTQQVSSFEPSQSNIFKLLPSTCQGDVDYIKTDPQLPLCEGTSNHLGKRSNKVTSLADASWRSCTGFVN